MAGTPREERPGEIAGKTLGEVEGWKKKPNRVRRNGKHATGAEPVFPCTPINHLQDWQGQVGPPADLLRGPCPVCGSDLVSTLVFVEGTGYLLTWQCWNGLLEVPTCEYRRLV